MQRLTGIDAAFLYLETPSAHMHVTGTVVLNPATMPGGRDVDRVAGFMTERVRGLPIFSKRLVNVPFGLSHPVWVDDGDFEPADHIRRSTVSDPGSPRELAKMIGRIAGKPLLRDKPMWELWILDGLADGHLALVTKVHHALIDGMLGAELMNHLFDLEPDAKARSDAPSSREAERQPSPVELLTSALASLTTQPLRLARTVVETGRSLVPLLGPTLSAGRRGGSLPTLPFTAPRTRFSGAISPARAVAFGKATLTDVKRIKNAFGVTVNDVVLAGCTMALRRYLESHDELPDRPLVATIPVAVASEEQTRQLGNSVSAMFVSLPVHVPDPVIQLMRIGRDTRRAKKLHNAIGPNMLTDWVQHAPAAVMAQAARLYSHFKLADRVPPIHNLVISNVPGPPMPLYAAGARVMATYPMGPILEGAAINITVLSYQDSIDFGVIACREALADPWIIAEGFERAISELRAIADLEMHEEPGHLTIASTPDTRF